MPKHDLNFHPPLMNSAGTLGFTPDLYSAVDWSKLGAFITNPISLAPRTPAHGQRFVNFPGGFLLHTGYPNPGLSQAIRHYARHWKRSPIPVVVHLLARSATEIAEMTERLEAAEGVMGLEIGVASEVNADSMEASIQAASGELPVIIRLPPERAAELAGRAIQSGATAISLAPPRGVLPGSKGELIQGRLYGPALLPLTLRVVREISVQGFPIIAASGVTTRQDMEALLAAGATAIQLDSVLWRGAGYNLWA